MRTIALALLLAASATSGCATLSGNTESGNGETKNQVTVQVNSAPPAEKTEANRPAAPGFGYIWVAGYWDYLDGNYVWRDGRWVQGKPDYEYIRARYEYDGKAWLFHRPHWKKRAAKITEGPKPNP
ncbi:MAG: hypothetical protein JWN44_1360 [Myxococcales bacterium]|nr:hypothetical protein [Myxococcales bacterium]